jgi:hypothetical protein
MRVSAALVAGIALFGGVLRATTVLAEETSRVGPAHHANEDAQQKHTKAGGAHPTQGEPLHVVIDQQLAPVAGLQPARCSDAEFVRRVSLDLVGMPPTADEARAFITDAATDKRERLIERLFASPQFVRNLTAVLDVMLMERRPNTNVTVDEWQAWLLKCVQENMPWNMLVREILAADGDDPAKRPAARFVLDRGSDPHGITRDIGRIFFGRDMQCAQCHDHPLIGDYLQSDYHGMLAFVSPSYALVRKEGDKQITLAAEKAGTDLSFESVFVGVPRRTGPRVLASLTLDEPFLLPGEDYDVPPAENVKSVPKFSRRAKLAELATNGSNQAFNWNIVNRLWAHMFGRGLVHPPDLHHPNNPPSHPELLQALSDYFVTQMNFDMRQFLREIALSGAYQRSFDPPTNLFDVSEQAAIEIARLEQQRAELEKVTQAAADSYAKASEAWEQAEAAWLPVAGELDTARTQYGDARKKVDEALQAVKEASTQFQAKKSVADPVQQAATAAEAATKVLPEDKELAEAAQKFVARAQKLAEEAAALSKAVNEKNAAVQPMTEALNSTKPIVEAARTKMAPLKQTLSAVEQAMRTERTKAASDAKALAALDRRLATARLVAKLPVLHRAVAAASESASARRAELTAAQKQLRDFAAVVARCEAQGKAAGEKVTATANALQAAAASRASQAEAARSISAALTAIESARQNLPNDAALADLANKLQTRTSVTQSHTGELQRRIDALTMAEKVAQQSFVAAQESLAAALAEKSRREQAIEAANQAIAASQAECTAKQAELDSLAAEATGNWTRDFTVAALKPLTPEQLCWTVFRVTGVYDRYWQAEVAELDKTKPLSEEQRRDAAQLVARNIDLEQRTYDKLKGNVGTFVAFYGAGAGQPQSDFFATADQALFAANGGAINSWVAPAGDNVTERIVKQNDLRVAAEELYLGVLTRFPTEQEAADVVAYLGSRGSDKPVAAQELVWGLLNSAEFRFNH